MEEFRRKDFNNLLLNCYDVNDSDDIFKVFPILDKYKVFTAMCRYKKGDDTVEILHDKTKLIKYIIYTYDPNSPFKKINDTLERRAAAAEFAGYEVTNKNFDEAVDKMIRCILPEVNRMIIQFCLMHHEEDYATLVVYLESHRKELENLSKEDVDPKDVTNIIKNIKTFEREIAEKKNKLLAGNMDSFINKTLFEYMESKKLKLSPEYVAKSLVDWDNISIYYKKTKINT